MSMDPYQQLATVACAALVGECLGMWKPAGIVINATACRRILRGAVKRGIYPNTLVVARLVNGLVQEA